jgi:hypothetical protein
VDSWLKGLGLGEADLRCGSHVPYDEAARDALYRHHAKPCQLHNNCSGKHAGFLTLNRHLGGGAEYVEVDHPVQKAVRAAYRGSDRGRSKPRLWHRRLFGPELCADNCPGLARAMGLLSLRQKKMARQSA